MVEQIGLNWALAWLRDAEVDLVAARVRLNELDRAIGDGDHGENMARGMTAVGAALAEAQAPSLPAVLTLVARTLISTVGGASGPLYGTAFLRASKAVPEQIDARGVTALLTAALDGIVARGGAAEGDKTMVDAWSPACAAANRAAGAALGPAEALRAAADAAADGALATLPLVARKGRASYLGDRAIGHRDPGAESTAILLQAAARTAEALA